MLAIERGAAALAERATARVCQPVPPDVLARQARRRRRLRS